MFSLLRSDESLTDILIRINYMLIPVQNPDK